MKRYIVTLIGVVGMAVMMDGCAKRVKPVEPVAGVEEERVALPPQTGELAVPSVAQPEIAESEAGAKLEVRAKSGVGAKEEAMAALAQIYFDFDQYNIREDMRASLEANAKWLLSNPKVAVAIEGHADERGTNEYNLALGERRVRAIKQFLGALGVDAGRLSTISFGEERPACQNPDENCYSKNRRAHFSVR